MAISATRKKELEKSVSNWLSLMNGLNNMNEEEAKYLLDQEVKLHRRLSVAIRLYGRYSKQRRAREKREMRLCIAGQPKKAGT